MEKSDDYESMMNKRPALKLQVLDRRLTAVVSCLYGDVDDELVEVNGKLLECYKMKPFLHPDKRFKKYEMVSLFQKCTLILD